MSTAIARPVRIPVLPIVIGIAWILAIFAEAMGYGHLIHHDHLAGRGTQDMAALFLLTGAWQLHVTAMMLPSSLPLIELFGQAARGQARPLVARATFLGGYMVVWTVFGVLALVGDSIIHELVHRSSWLEARPELMMGGALLLAGAFQFSKLKDSCLTECRHPAAFIQRHYRRGVRAAGRLGMRHGLSCLGCCWALMLLMFAVGITNLLWMAPLALLMTVEKTMAGGRMLVRPVGGALMLAGAAVIAASLMPGWI